MLEFFFVWSVFARSQRSTICLSERTEELCVEGRKCIFRAGSREGVRGVAGVAMATLIFCILFKIKLKGVCTQSSQVPKFLNTKVPKFPCIPKNSSFQDPKKVVEKSCVGTYCCRLHQYEFPTALPGWEKWRFGVF